jgi:hypothetical protein
LYTERVTARIYHLHGTCVFEAAADGPPFAGSQDAVTLIGEARSQGGSLVVIPTARLSPDFFRLRTGIAGDLLQKFVNYQVRVAILGNIDDQIAASVALRDFVRESNRGASIWFCKDQEELAAKLAA